MSRVLIVDDEALIRTSVANRIEKLNPSALVSGMEPNGVSALDWLNLHYADVCITDVRMPKMDGIQLIRSIKERFPWMACIVVSSYDDFEYAKQCLQLGAKDYILKPIDPNLLGQALQQAELELDKTRYQEATALIIQNFHCQSGLLDKWTTTIQTLQRQALTLLLADTLETLESWVGGQSYLLPTLSRIWMNLIVENMKLSKLNWAMSGDSGDVPQDKTISRSEIRTYFRLCAMHTLEEAGKECMKQMKSLKESPNKKVIKQVKDYVQSHYAEKISLQDIATSVNMSRTYLSNMFHKETGLTVWNYLVIVRMEKAREFLLDSSLRSYEIAQKVGYDNSIHFSHLFKGHFGLNPMEYKKRMES